MSATEFWKDIAAGSLLPHLLLGRFAETAARFRPEETEELEDELDSILGGVYPGLTSEATREGREPAKQSEIGCWAGRYQLLDDTGAGASLRIADGRVALFLGDDILQTFRFADGMLRITGEGVTVELRFAVPVAEAHAVGQVAARAAEVRCTGTVTRARDGVTTTHAIRGKRGCFTPDGVDYELDGDPPATWEGGYTLSYPDTQEELPAAFVFDTRPGSTLVTFRGAAGTGARVGSNCIAFAVGGDADHRVSGAFQLDEHDRKGFLGVERKDGIERVVVGTLTEGLRPVRRMLRAAAHGLLGDPATPPVSRAPTKLALSTTPTAPDARAILSIPKGTERTLYEIDVELTGLTGLSKGTAVQVALVDDLAANPEPFMPVKQILTVAAATATSATTARATLRSTQGETHSAAVYNVRLDVGTLSVRVKFEVYSLESLVINQVEAPAPVRGKAYRLMLSASGGREPYTWTPITEGLPPGLRFSSSPTTGYAMIEGTVDSTIDHSQETYSVVAEVSCDKNADDVVGIQRARRTLTLQISEGQQVASNQLAYASYAFGLLAGCFMLFDFFYSKLSAQPGDELAKQAKEFIEGKDGAPSGLTQFLDNMKKINDALAADTTAKDALVKENAQLKLDLAAQQTETQRLSDHVKQLQRDLADGRGDIAKIRQELHEAGRREREARTKETTVKRRVAELDVADRAEANRRETATKGKKVTTGKG